MENDLEFILDEETLYIPLDIQLATSLEHHNIINIFNFIIFLLDTSNRLLFFKKTIDFYIQKQNLFIFNNNILNIIINNLLKKDDDECIKYLVDNKILPTSMDDLLYNYICRSLYLKSNKCIKYFLNIHSDNDIIKFNYIYKNDTIITYAMKLDYSEDEFIIPIYYKYINDGGDIKYVNKINNNNLLHYSIYFNYDKLSKIIYEANNALARQQNIFTKLPGDYCIYTNIFCNSLPKNFQHQINLLYKNNLDDIITNEFPNINILHFYIKNSINIKIDNINADILGKGGFGSTFIINYNDKKYCIKLQNICSSRNTILCNNLIKTINMEDDAIMIIKNNFYQIIRYNNIISEIIISIIINNINKSTNCINIINTINFMFIHKKAYTIMELLDGPIGELFKDKTLNEEHYLNILIQIFYGIYILHTYNIYHNDIHYGNILYKKIKYPNGVDNAKTEDYLINNISTEFIEYFEYCIEGINIRIKNLGYIIKLIDFGLSFIDFKKDGKTYLIRPLYILPIEGSVYLETNRNTDLLNFMLTFMKISTNINFNTFYLLNNIQHYDPLIINIGNNISKIIINNNEDIYNFKRPYRNNKLSLKLVFASYKDIAYGLLIELNKIRKTNTLLEINKSTKCSIFNIFTNFNYNIKMGELNESIYIPTNINDLNIDDNSKMYRISDHMFASNYIINNYLCKNGYTIKGYQYINLVKIMNYKQVEIDSTCCNISGSLLLDNLSKDKSYVTINGSFFDIKKTYNPIGMYKDTYINNINEKFKINDMYIDIYYILLCTNDKDFQIIKYTDFIKNLNSYTPADYIFIIAVAPLLYSFKYSNDIMKDMVLLNKTNNIDLFDCKNEELNLAIVNKKFNCRYIKPGELKHGKQLNPRSLFIIKNNELLLIVIEGRNNRGNGMTFEDMYNLSLELNAVESINLDGGRSSHIAIKPKNFNKSIIMNPVYKENSSDLYPRNEYYPVGNIFNFSE